MSATSLSSNEFCILQLLWTEGRALTRPEILEALPDKDWNPNSIHLILNNMIKKGVLQVNGRRPLRPWLWPAPTRLP